MYVQALPRMFQAAVASFLLAAALPFPVLASDGRIEINQACVATGCFPGDGPGFPVTIVRGGSYLFTSDIDVREETEPQNVTAVEVNISGMNGPEGTTVDLNGFRVIGPNLCLNTPVQSCNNVGTGIGIMSNDNRVTIRNGRVLGMGALGIDVVSDAVVEDVHVEDCGTGGMEIGPRSRVIRSTITRNNGDALLMANGGLVLDNVIVGNAGIGLIASGTGYGRNIFSLNAGGNVSFGTQIGTNICGATACP